VLPRFDYIRPTSPAQARSLLESVGSAALGGGTDLLVCLREELTHAIRLVDVSELADSRSIDWRADGSVRIGSAVRVAELAADAKVRARLGTLAQACESVGTPALRNMGTIAGNLCQRPRCWYFRRNIPCLKNGGDNCPAVNGENQYHAIFGDGPCYAVHPSDPAVALTALDASIVVEGNGGSRAVPIAEFFVTPRQRMDQETMLDQGELVSAIEIPSAALGGIQRYEKLMQRGAWDFALVSLAAVKRENGDVRLVLGGVAGVPWRVTDSIEEDIASGSLDRDDIATLAERALYDARPLSGNGYKIEMAAALLRRAMLELAGL
jgi:xanthine dehydrogenase YagS FAD-binding subunit